MSSICSLVYASVFHVVTQSHLPKLSHVGFLPQDGSCDASQVSALRHHRGCEGLGLYVLTQYQLSSGTVLLLVGNVHPS